MTYRRFPTIVTSFINHCPQTRQAAYRHVIENLLDEILPEHLFQEDSNDEVYSEKQKKEFEAIQPLIKTSNFPDAVPSFLSFYALFPLQQGASKFFFEMFSRWLVPGRRLNVILLYAVDFSIPSLSNKVYTLCDLMVLLEHPEELKEIAQNLPLIEAEVKAGVVSPHTARHILETRGMTPDEKNALVQERVSYLIKRWPQRYDQTLLTEMQHLMVMAKEEFKSARRAEHLTYIIILYYHFRQQLQQAIPKDPNRRHIQLKIFRGYFQEGHQTHPVLCLAIGLNLTNEKELFADRHVLKAVKSRIPNVKFIEGSSYIQKRNHDSLSLLYLEISKIDGGRFNDEEIAQLREILPLALCDRVEQLIHPVFMPRNEEEILRNILQLSKQVNYVNDPPQIFIAFDEQTHTHLSFLVTMVRLTKPGDPTLEEIFHRRRLSVEYMQDRCKFLGFVRKKYLKEAIVFRLRLRHEGYVRLDHTLDLNRARQFVVQELESVLGEVRDYNGGMIFKQHEALMALREVIGEQIKYNDLLLENFFYSLMPVIMRTLLDKSNLKILFMMLLNAVENQVVSGQENILNIQVREEQIYFIAITKDLSFKDELRKALESCAGNQKEQTHSFVQVYDCFCWCYILRSPHDKQTQVCSILKEAMSTWRKRTQHVFETYHVNGF